MQGKNDLKSFRCSIHTSETIQRVCLEPNVETALRCIECILNSNEKVAKDSIITLKDFVDHAVRQYETFRRISAFEDSAPQNFVDFLGDEEARVNKLSAHIEEEKEKVSNAFNSILQEFTLLTHSKKEEIFRMLDKQLVSLRLNYSYYKSKIDRYYNKDKEEELNPNREALLQKINQCQDTNEMEVLVKNIKDDIVEASTYKDPQIKIREVKEGLKNLATELKRQSNIFPTSHFHDLQALEESLKKFRETVTPVMEDFCSIENNIYELSLSQATSIDSKIVTKPEDATLLKKWISPSGYVRFKLLYRATRDTFDANVFHKKCDDQKETLTIAKSNLGKIFGGYSDVVWNVTNNYKQSNNTWLFSINEKEKFPVKKNNTQSIYTNQGYGPTFGGGHDLYIYLNQAGFGGQNSYSNLGHSYEVKVKGKGNKGNNQTILAGAYQFGVEEVEVFAIDTKGTGSVSSDEFESALLDPKKDLALLKNWIARGKKVSLELLYRGSRDGFGSNEFHEKCDEQGATLVVCKSAAYEKVFGGFTSVSWSQVNDFVFDKEAFLFSVSNDSKHPIIKGDCAIFCSAEAGPVFGAGYDLFICANSNIVEDSSSTLGMTYKANDNLGDLTAYLAGTSHFMLKDIEVFKVTIEK